MINHNIPYTAIYYITYMSTQIITKHFSNFKHSNNNNIMFILSSLYNQL